MSDLCHLTNKYPFVNYLIDKQILIKKMPCNGLNSFMKSKTWRRQPRMYSMQTKALHYSPCLSPNQFIKKPYVRCSFRIIPINRPPIAIAHTRDKKPITNKIAPKNSIKIPCSTLLFSRFIIQTLCFVIESLILSLYEIYLNGHTYHMLYNEKEGQFYWCLGTKE